jgi:hypothetical protein
MISKLFPVLSFGLSGSVSGKPSLTFGRILRIPLPFGPRHRADEQVPKT